MIFNNNTTGLGVRNIPMAEGYDCSCGVAQALIESARNDFSMFKAMLDVDAQELQINRESAGYVNEGELVSLREAALGGIWAKIKELLTKLVAKIKAIFGTFMSKINSLFMSDKSMVKKYEKQLLRKSNLGKMEVKWSKITTFGDTILIKGDSKQDKVIADLYTELGTGNYKKDDTRADRVEGFLTKFLGDSTDESSFAKDFHDKCFEDEEKMELGETSETIRGIMSYLTGSAKTLSNIKHNMDSVEKGVGKLIQRCDKELVSLSKIKAGKDGNAEANGTYYNRKTGVEDGEIAKGANVDAELASSKNAYEMTQAFQTAELKNTSAIIEAFKYRHKMYKAVFMKAIGVNDKKLEESSIFADALAEAAEEEVTEVIDKALDNEELSKINVASKNVLDSDVSDDPGKLTYGPDCYTPNRSYVQADGSVDTEINSKEEAAFFGQMLY